jgi:N-acetylmuramoyl-L-alanine amidase
MRPATKLIVLHYPQWAGASAERVRDYFDSVKSRHASSQYVIGIQGEVLELMPPDEVAWHCGSESYTTYMQKQYAKWTTNEPQRTPNWISVGIEVCHAEPDGQWSDAAVDSSVALVRMLMDKYDLEPTQVLRHYDVTGKVCPAYYVVHPDKWARYRATLRE